MRCDWLVRLPLPTSSALFESSRRNTAPLHVDCGTEHGNTRTKGRVRLLSAHRGQTDLTKIFAQRPRYSADMDFHCSQPGSGGDGSCCVPPLFSVWRYLEKREHRARRLFYSLFPGHPAQRVIPGSRDSPLLHVRVHGGRLFVKTRGYGTVTAQRLDQISSGHTKPIVRNI